MALLQSPWLAQLRKSRTVKKLSRNTTTDVVIVGGGIAGITTAYCILKYTNLNVVLAEAFKVAHGATGHNAGQITSYFERQFSNIVKEYGLELAADAQNAIDSAWLLLNEIYDDALLKTPFATFTGYAGCQDLEEIHIHLENIKLCHEAKIKSETLLIAQIPEIMSQIDNKYQPFFTYTSHSDILEKLETKNNNYIAAVTARKGCMNSALFCEDLVQFLLTRYRERFQLAEHSKVDEIQLNKDGVTLQSKDKTIKAQHVVLCTNGYKNFIITDSENQNSNEQFQTLVTGTIGYMAGYLEEPVRTPIAISYLPKHAVTESTQNAEAYIYLTRRTYESGTHAKQNLICIGGPETLAHDSTKYKYTHPYPQEAQRTIDEFLKNNYLYAPSGDINYAFKWHGLMGYTPNGIRCIGPHPDNNRLLFNLGCNGVGILPSLYGAKKISQYLNGEKLNKSLFSPTYSLKKSEK
jgi:glycine/D-amino acid oxidase-like deaminating enzyme